MPAGPHPPRPFASPPPLAALQLLEGIRRALGLDVDSLAKRIGASPAHVAALEAGRFAHLPPWPETAVIAGRWIGLAGIDPRPALAELAEHLSPRAVGPTADAGLLPASTSELHDDTDDRIAAIARVLGNRGKAPGPDAAAPGEKKSAAVAGAAGRADAVEEKSPLRRQPGRPLRLVASRAAEHGAGALKRFSSALGSGYSRGRQSIGFPSWRVGLAAALLLGLLGAASNSTVVAAGASVLPAPAGRAVRSFSDFLAEHFAPVREGHRWIDVADPRSRRADKLRITPRSD